jgi:signal transduction histidine kinase
MKVLHLEDDVDDATIIEYDIQRSGVGATFVPARSRDEFILALGTGPYDAIIVDNSLPGFRAPKAIAAAKSVHPHVPVIVCSGAAREADVAESVAAGASDYVLKDHAWQLAAALRRIAAKPVAPVGELPRPAMLMLVDVVQKLSMARGLDMIVGIVRRAARALTGADGATFVLRDGNYCYYVDEDAILPLWKGQRFPLETCISGWAMLNGKSTVIPDIYQDARIPHAAYRPTFVKSLAMVPIRTAAPIGSIGTYWARHHECTSEELLLLEALANTTAVAMENVAVYESLERQVRERTAELEGANQELEAFSAAVSHDLRAPLRAINAALEDACTAGDVLQPASVGKLRRNARCMGLLIDDLLRLSKAGHAQLALERIGLGGIARRVVARLQANEPERRVEVHIDADQEVLADRALMKVVLENLLSNAWKYSSKRAIAHISFTAVQDAKGCVYRCSDNGAGFDPAHTQQLFKPFSRLHEATEFPGVGIGLITVQRIIQRHGGHIWAESDGTSGARFLFTLGKS